LNESFAEDVEEWANLWGDSSFDPEDRSAETAPPVEDSGAAPLHELDSNPRYRVLRNFRSRFLPDARDISIYLPEAYRAQPRRRFPVFYLHDGQNLFDGRTSYVVNRTWRAHEAADILTRAGLIEPLILVGIANTGVRRMAEYTPTRDPKLGGGEGARYGRLLVEDLKPLIDRRFRTLPNPENTALGGSSLGGLITLALGLEYPDIFGKLAVISPSIWWDNRSLLTLVNEIRSKPALKIWLDMGTAEGLRHLRDADLLHRRLIMRGWRDGVDLKYLRAPGAVHDEDAWAARFEQVLRFLFPAPETPAL
jgi:predicted alpha/beta superfamily hydrolase